MKNSDIFDNLSYKEARTRLAETYRNNMYIGVNNESLEIQLREHQRNIKLLSEAITTNNLAKNKNWEFYDISDDIEDYNELTYLPFVGTLEELKSKFNTNSCGY